MNHIDRSHVTSRLLLFVLILALVSTASAEWNEKVLYSFQGGANDGATPAGGAVFDSAGNLYGATTQGGGDDCPIDQCGTVFELTPPHSKGDSWTETLLHIFKGNGSGDGNTPAGSVILDSAGNLYGTTAYGGNGNCILLGTKAGCGTVFELSPPKQKGGRWTETLLHNFQGGNDGYFPNGNLVFDKAGNLYGATMFGGGKGTSCNPYYQYCGTVFELSRPKQKGGKWIEKVLHSFAGVDKGGPPGDGANPNGGLVLDSEGAVYGTTQAGGLNTCSTHENQGCGTVFKLTPPTKKGSLWTETILHRFSGGDDGGQPNGALIFDAKGSLYGSAGGGNPSGGGIAFQLTASKAGRWKETVLHWFSDNGPGAFTAGLIFDSSGNLYGPTAEGSEFRGTVVRLKHPARQGGEWTPTVLYTFQESPDGAGPVGHLIFDAAENLYGTTEGGGSSSYGAVFEVEP